MVWVRFQVINLGYSYFGCQLVIITILTSPSHLIVRHLLYQRVNVSQTYSSPRALSGWVAQETSNRTVSLLDSASLSANALSPELLLFTVTFQLLQATGHHCGKSSVLESEHPRFPWSPSVNHCVWSCASLWPSVTLRFLISRWSLRVMLTPTFSQLKLHTCLQIPRWQREIRSRLDPAYFICITALWFSLAGTNSINTMKWRI